MRVLRQLTMSVVLTFAFATYGFAGIIPTVPGPDPAPPTSSASATGITDTPPSDVAASNVVLEVVMNLLQTGLLVF